MEKEVSTMNGAFISVKVTYTVKPGFALKNQENISAFMNDVRRINHPDVRYNVYLGSNAKTFTHISLYKDEAAQKAFLALESFKYFQQQRDESGLEVAPQIETMKLVDSSEDLFF
jgi:quinol monooxygenase YgiN